MVTITLEANRDGSLLIGLLLSNGLVDRSNMMSVSDSLTVIDPISRTQITLTYTEFDKLPLLKSGPV